MKRLLTVLLFAAMLLALALPAAADVAYLPRDNFIEKHWDECRYENRWYYTNGPEGYVLARKSPETKEGTPLPNGGKYYISNIYQDRWGVLEYNPDTLENDLSNNSVSAWVDMKHMTADYDNIAFMADHQSELVEKEATLEYKETDTVYVYKYPGSGEVVSELSGDWFEPVLNFNTVFTDPAGREWGYCAYHYGNRNLWVCIDDPFNGALEPDENCVMIGVRTGGDPTPAAADEPTQESKPAPVTTGKTIEITPKADDQTLAQAAKDNRGIGPYIAAGAAGIVVIAAAVLIAVLRKKQR